MGDIILSLLIIVAGIIFILINIRYKGDKK